MKVGKNMMKKIILVLMTVFLTGCIKSSDTIRRESEKAMERIIDGYERSQRK